MNKKLQKITAEKIFDSVLKQKLQFTYPFASIKDAQASYRRNLQPSKKNIQHFKT
jgi:hypothetical protein